jgi:iron-sulfur cluster repair protein YtfE (RIC family)
MTTTTGSREAIWAFIEHEHLDLVRGINRIHEVACEVDHQATPMLSADVVGVLSWLETSLEPHMAWEEVMLYPEIDRRAGTTWATRAARFEHQQIREAVAAVRLGQKDLADHDAIDPRADVRCRMFALEALVRAHVEREERLLIPELNEDFSGTGVDAMPGAVGRRLPEGHG